MSLLRSCHSLPGRRFGLPGGSTSRLALFPSWFTCYRVAGLTDGVRPGSAGQERQIELGLDRMMKFGWTRAALVLASFIGGLGAAQADRIKNPTAVFSGLDKITGRIVSFEVGIDETVQFGALQMTPRVCFTKPPTETPNTTSFIEVDEPGSEGKTQGLLRLAVRRKPRPPWHRASGLRHLARGLQRRHGSDRRSRRKSAEELPPIAGCGPRPAEPAPPGDIMAPAASTAPRARRAVETAAPAAAACPQQPRRLPAEPAQRRLINTDR